MNFKVEVLAYHSLDLFCCAAPLGKNVLPPVVGLGRHFRRNVNNELLLQYLSARCDPADRPSSRSVAVPLVPTAARFGGRTARHGTANARAVSQQRPRTLGHGPKPLGPAGNREGHLPQAV